MRLIFLIKERNTDILCVSETWLCPNINDNFIFISDFKVVRCDKGREGGVCMYIIDDLKVTPMNVNTERPEGVEDVWVAVQCFLLL